jgi:hypothetical protein
MGMVGNNESYRNLVNNIENTTKTESTGLLQDLFKGLGDLFSGWAGMVSAACAILCCSICCVLIIMLVMGSASSASGGGGGQNASASAGGYY